MKGLVRYLITVVALILAAGLIPGIKIEETAAWVAVAIMAATLGLVDTLLRPILQLLSCGCIAATLGTFTLAIDAFALWFSSYLVANVLGIGLVVDGFWPAFWGGLVVSLVSLPLSRFVPDD